MAEHKTFPPVVCHGHSVANAFPEHGDNWRNKNPKMVVTVWWREEGWLLNSSGHLSQTCSILTNFKWKFCHNFSTNTKSKAKNFHIQLSVFFFLEQKYRGKNAKTVQWSVT